METETIDRLFLELSQVTRATTGREAKLLTALVSAEAALSDIGDADREPGDDLAWCERRAAKALPAVREALKPYNPKLSRARSASD